MSGGRPWCGNSQSVILLSARASIRAAVRRPLWTFCLARLIFCPMPGGPISAHEDAHARDRLRGTGVSHGPQGFVTRTVEGVAHGQGGSGFGPVLGGSRARL